MKRIVKGYELRERIGAGGFGTVYRAFQPSVGREVAIKVILPQYANHPDFVRRFEVEAQVVARLEHPHIVPLYDFWRDPEGTYLIMRLLRTSLRDALGDGKWSLEATARLLDQISSALMIAHREGIVHRDVKPSNILLDEDNNAYLADFGIAKDVHMRTAGSGIDADEGAGSSEYVSPEQIRSQEVTSRSDLYSLGYVLYEMLTGHSPFPEATTPSDYIQKHLTEPLPMLSFQHSSIPAAVDEVLQTVTAKDPLYRYATAQRFAAAFRAALPIALPRILSQPLTDALTERELEVLALAVQDLTNGEIAKRLFLTSGTVKWYFKQIYSKLDVHSRQQAIERAERLQLFKRRPGAALPDPQADEPLVHSVELPAPIRLLDPENPYKGLHAFQEADAADFFGRAAMTERLLSHLSEQGDESRFLVIVGPSGSGKSSLVRAGLLPALRKGALTNSPHPFIVEMLPGTHPLEELEEALLRVAIHPLPGLLDQLREDRRGLVRAAKHMLPHDQSTELIVLVDQFEEVFTLTTDAAMRTQFIDTLLSAATDPRGRVRVILTLRADFYDRPLLYPRLAELVRAGTEVIVPLTAREMEQAIIAPAERVGLRLEAGLISTILNDLAEQPGMLPLLQYALTELCQRREGLTLTLAAYQAMGGVLGALARRADEIYAVLNPDARALGRQMLLRLITVGEGTEDTRRRVLLSELNALGNEDTMEDLINAFADYRLLTLDHDPVTRTPIVEIAHEALIREWSRLREWLAIAHEDIRLQRQVDTAAQDWQNAHQDDSFLLRGTRLDIFSRWAVDTTLALTPQEQNYLSASNTAYEREQQAETERRAQEARWQRRSRTFLRGLVIVLGLAAVIASALSLAALGERNRANAALVGEQEARTVIEENVLALRELALVNGAQAAYASSDLDTARALSLAANMGENPSSQSQRILADAAYAPGTVRVLSDDRYPYDWDFSTLSPDGNTLIASSYFGNRELVVWNVVAGEVVGIFPTRPNDSISFIAFRPTIGSQDWQLLTGSEDGTMTLWDYARQQPLRTFAGDSVVWTAVFSPDGRRIASGSDDGTIHIWDTDSGDLLQTLTDYVISVGALTFNSDGTQLLSASVDGTVMLWDTATGHRLAQFDTGLFPTGLAFNPDATRFLISSWTPNIMSLWDIETRSQIRTFSRVGLLSGAIFSPDGQTVFMTEGNSITFLNINTGEVTRSLTGHTHAVTGIFPNADATQLLTVSRDGTIRQWDLRNGAEIVHTQSLFPYLILDGAISPDRRTFAVAAGGGTIRLELPGLLLLYDAVTGAEIRRFGVDGVAHTAASPNSVLYASTSSVRYSPDGQTIVSASWGGEIKLWDMNTGSLLWEVPGITSAVNSVDFTPDGSGLIAAADNGALMPDECTVMPDEGVAISDECAALADEGAVIWVNAATGEITRHYSFGASVKKAIFTRDATRFLACLADESSSIVLVDVETGETLRRLTGQTQACDSLAVAPDDLTAVSGHPDGSILLWDLTSGQLIRRFTGGLGRVVELIFSHDGQTVYSGSFPGAAQSLNVALWDVASGELYRRYIGSPVPVDALDLSADGRTLLAGSYDGIARLWRIDDLTQLIDWTRANRYVPELTCEQRALYRLEPLCDAGTAGH
ncbi:MAG: protein kinase [Chloroflexota bacterium]